jgi:hypothetical protein
MTRAMGPLPNWSSFVSYTRYSRKRAPSNTVAPAAAPASTLSDPAACQMLCCQPHEHTQAAYTEVDVCVNTHTHREGAQGNLSSIVSLTPPPSRSKTTFAAGQTGAGHGNAPRAGRQWPACRSWRGSRSTTGPRQPLFASTSCPTPRVKKNSKHKNMSPK